MSVSQQKVYISVTNDLINDYRVHRTAHAIQQLNLYKVVLIGRKLKNSPPLQNRSYKTVLLRIPVDKGPFFYLLYTCTLFFYLLFQKRGILLSNDLDTLPANFLIAKLKRQKLIFDAHELFTEVPELIGRKGVQRVWRWIEQLMVPKTDVRITVCQSIADWYSQHYGLSFEVIRNIPETVLGKEKTELPDVCKENKVILYQGVINIGRGIENVIKAMSYLNRTVFLIVGDGDVMPQIKDLVKKLSLQQKVILMGRLPFQMLSSITQQADLGISLEENMGMNYYYALPNKLFGYIHSNVPVLVSDFPEMARIVNQYKIGKTTLERDPEKLAKMINEILSDESLLRGWKANLIRAAEDLSWDKEKEKLIKIFHDIGI